ncbi:hypothetical protein ACFXG4_35790 [Nocardia sp. NPDC059246]|uniref:hypothetical protein n=1 Tax=unclassified Nocardia TaxID=2637762 RepID=UPI0036802583
MPKLSELSATTVGATVLVTSVIVVAAAAPLWDYFFSKRDAPLAGGAGVIAAATFFGVWLIQRKHAQGRANRNSMRDAIAAGFVVTYLVLVAWTAFLNLIGRGGNGLDPLTANFTVLTGVVVGGYFTADAAKQIAQIKAGAGNTPTDDKAEVHTAGHMRSA